MAGTVITLFLLAASSLIKPVIKVKGAEVEIVGAELMRGWTLEVGAFLN